MWQILSINFSFKSNQPWTLSINQLDHGGLSFIYIVNILESMITSDFSLYNFIFSCSCHQIFMSRVYELNKMSWGIVSLFHTLDYFVGDCWLFFLICLVNRKIIWVFSLLLYLVVTSQFYFLFLFMSVFKRCSFLKTFPFHWNFQICWHKITYNIFLVYTIHNSVSIILSTLASWFCYFFLFSVPLFLNLARASSILSPFLKN